MKWWEKKEEDDKVELPKEIQEQLDQVKKVSGDVDKINTKLGALDSITEWIAAQKADKEAENAKRRVPPPKTQEELADEDADLANLLLTNPREAYARLAAKTDTT